MQMMDNDRRYTDANAAARLLFRMSLSEMRSRRVDDVTAEANLPAMEARWAQLLDHGSVIGRHTTVFPDGSTLSLMFAGIANVLPAQHLGMFVPADWPGNELEAMQPAEDGADGSLSPRQLEVLRLVAVGSDARQIAAELSISDATVRTHVKNVLARLGARNRAHAVAIAMATGLLGEDLLEVA
jgi:DNA-binding CsgD family transcriptional regulator